MALEGGQKSAVHDPCSTPPTPTHLHTTHPPPYVTWYMGVSCSDWCLLHWMHDWAVRTELQTCWMWWQKISKPSKIAHTKMQKMWKKTFGVTKPLAQVWATSQGPFSEKRYVNRQILRSTFKICWSHPKIFFQSWDFSKKITPKELNKKVFAPSSDPLSRVLAKIA